MKINNQFDSEIRKDLKQKVQNVLIMTSEQRRKKYKLLNTPIKNTQKALKEFKKIKKLDHQIAFMAECVGDDTYDLVKFLRTPEMTEWLDVYGNYFK